MFSRATALRGAASRAMRPSNGVQTTAKRQMGGGAHWMDVSKQHTWWGEAFGTVAWLWIFHRARNDLPVVLGWRHPWDHAEDPWAPDVHINTKVLSQDWDTFGRDSAIKGEDDDDDDEDEDEDDDEEEDDE